MSVDARELRSALGCFATGVIIVTASYEGSEHGMTANAFTSVSLKPPLVLICIDNDARMSRVLERGMDFGISVLAEDQQALSRHFAGRPQDGAVVQFAWHRGVPVIDGAVARFVCKLMDSRVVGDHTIHIAEVEYFERMLKSPLLFSCGAYASLQRSG